MHRKLLLGLAASKLRVLSSRVPYYNYLGPKVAVFSRRQKRATVLA